LQQDWLFDDFTSVTVLEELGNGVEARDPQTLQLVAENILHNLADYGYFTDVVVDGQNVELVLDPAFSAEVRDDRLALAFTMRLSVPADPRRQAFAYSVYDPTYFTEVLHADEPGAIALSDAAPAGCRPTVERPQPSPEDIAAAAALDVTESGGDQLGQLFAERVVLQCR
jgi:ABC-type uncharacterized transport system substrate-binding protein